MATELESQQQQEIEKLKGEIAELKQRAEDSAQTAAMHDAVRTAQSQPGRVPNGAIQAQQREQAIRTVGGNSFWASLSLDARLAALGERTPVSGEERTLAVKLFGKNPDSRQANSIARYSPAQYNRLRKIYREL